MDSLTQLTFWSCVRRSDSGEKGRQEGNSLGAHSELYPILTPLFLWAVRWTTLFLTEDSVTSFLLTLLTPLITWMITRIHPSTKKLFNKWLLLTFVVLNGSVLWTCLTPMGLKSFGHWILRRIPLPSIFIIDPLFTLPILIGVIAALFWKNHRLNGIGLSLGLAYLAWALGIGLFVKNKMEEKFAEQGYPILNSYPHRAFYHSALENGRHM